MSTQADHIISKFPSQHALARALGVKQSVISGWKSRGFIPAPQQPKVLRAANALGIAMTSDDFFPADMRVSGEAAPVAAA